jgi:DNA-directed RNA polymerase specialized sigma24 family protein
MEETVQKAGAKQDWVLTQGAFRRLLDWLDEQSDSGGKRYLEIRRRLVSYFDRKNCQSPDELADETLNRVARRLEEESEIITDAPAHYCYIVARFVFLEALRQEKRHEPLTDKSNAVAVVEATTEPEEREGRLRCLDHCMKELDSDGHHLIVGYYRGQQRGKIENRRAMAARLGISLNALSIRACRIRDKLETCLRDCLNRNS